ncbi:MAG: oleandomycin transport system permease protein [Actinomycetota bacterium]|jgi:ABC-2 type transport system permease protein/oleandomycin transport system permease protein|nr:oleandomycin transport system permease protein [Actinomycetota bacterium]
MTIASTTLDVRPLEKSRLGWAVSDTLAIAGRNLRAMQRVPQVIVFSTIQPVLFVLMFRYVFGGAIRVPGVRYVDYLMPGIFVQTIAFGSINTGIGLAEDLSRGLIERFRSLPMARSAVLAGRTLADVVRNVFVVSLMVLVGFLVGFRLHTSVLGLIAAVGVLLLFAFSLSWLFALIGMRATNAEAAQAASFPILAPLVFASSAFVPLASQPGWLQVFSRHQPVTITVNAVRALVLGGPTVTPVLQARAWAFALTAVFAPVAVAYYRRTA